VLYQLRLAYVKAESAPPAKAKDEPAPSSSAGAPQT